MCIAIYKPKGVAINPDYLWNGWKNNDDGAGFCYIDEHSEIIIHRSMTWLGFIDKYTDAEARYGETSPFLIHFRITSKGDTCLDNCHPFKVNDDMAIIHNGTMSSVYIPPNDKRSDTRVFAEDYLRFMPEGWHTNGIIATLIEEFIGYSKVLMLHRTDGVYIYNEEKGLWHEGCWFSNNSYESTKTVWYGSYRQHGAFKADDYEDWNYSNCDLCNTRTLWDDLTTYRPEGAPRNQYICEECMNKLMNSEDPDTKLTHALAVINGGKDNGSILTQSEVDSLMKTTTIDLDEDDYTTLYHCDYCCDSFDYPEEVACVFVEERQEYMYLCPECLDLFFLSGCNLYAVDGDGVIGEQLVKFA